MIAQLIPVKRLPASSRYYDYLVPVALEKSINSGDLVEINFRNQILDGVIFGLVKDSPVKNLKYLKKIKQAQFVLPWHFFLMKWFADYYQVSWSTYFHTFLPSLPKRQNQVKRYHPPKPTTSYQLSLAAPETKFILTDKHPFTLLMPDRQLDKYLFYFQLLEQEKKLVIFFPTLEELSLFYDILPFNVRLRTICLTSDLNKNQVWQSWQKIKQADTYLVLSTRSGVFFPFDPKTCLVVDRAEDFSHKQIDLNPRYAVWEILKKRQEFYPEQKCFFLSLAPKIEHYTYGQIKRWHLVDLQKKLSGLIFFDFSNYDDHSLVSAKLIEKINHQNTLIFLNRRGDFSKYYCRDCHWLAICPRCGQTLKLHHKQLICHHCKYQTDLILTCPNCRGPKLQGVGIGTANIKKFLSTKFPHRPILMITSENIEPVKLKKPYIIVGTEYSLTRVDFSNIELLIFLDPDQEFVQNDFRTNERVYQKMINIIRSVKPGTEIIIQTKQLEKNFWPLLQSYRKFWSQEMLTRRRYHYPPYVKLLKLIYANSDPDKTWHELNRLYYQLKNQKKPSDLEIMPPAKNQPFKQHRRYYGHILIKYQRDNWFYLKKYLNDDWLIDHDPERI